MWLVKKKIANGKCSGTRVAREDRDANGEVLGAPHGNIDASISSRSVFGRPIDDTTEDRKKKKHIRGESTTSNEIHELFVG